MEATIDVPMVRVYKDDELPHLQMKSLREISKCPICLETLSQDVVFCIKSHAICYSCKLKCVKKCPTCRSPFTKRKCILFQQILDVLSCDSYCQYCKKLLKSNDLHEMFCSQRPTDCKMYRCQWKGLAKDLAQHVTKHHVTENITLRHKMIKTIVRYSPLENFKYVRLISVSGYLFWKEVSNNPKSKLFTITYHTVPCGECKLSIYVKEKFITKNDEYENRIKLNLDPDIDSYVKNSIAIPIAMVKKFMNPAKKVLFYTFFTTDYEGSSI